MKNARNGCIFCRKRVSSFDRRWALVEWIAVPVVVCVQAWRSASHRHCREFSRRLGRASIQEYRSCCSYGTVQEEPHAVSQKLCKLQARFHLFAPGSKVGTKQLTPRRFFTSLKEECFPMPSPYMETSSSSAPDLRPPFSRDRSELIWAIRCRRFFKFSTATTALSMTTVISLSVGSLDGSGCPCCSRAAAP